jgi:mannose/fructose/N-acetylgalactosamine-specific phosphotransferase system component IIC
MKWFVALLIFIGSTANAGCVRPTAMTAAILDTVTTLSAISKPGVIELNPLGVVGSTIGKVLTFHYMKDADEKTQKNFDKWVGSLWTAAAVNNIAVFVGSSIAMPLGIISFLILKDINCEEEKTE